MRDTHGDSSTISILPSQFKIYIFILVWSPSFSCMQGHLNKWPCMGVYICTANYKHLACMKQDLVAMATSAT